MKVFGKDKKKNVVDDVVEEKSIATVVDDSLSSSMALGDVFMKSGMFTDIKSQAQAVVKILAGRELGLAPLESMTNIFLVNGKVALQAKVIGALIKKSKKYDYQVDKLDNEECHLTFFRLENGERKEIGKSSFTFKDAAKAGLVNKDVWKSYPRNMLFARALSNGAKWFASDVYCGYEQEEMESLSSERKTSEVAFNTITGEVIDNREEKDNG